MINAYANDPIKLPDLPSSPETSTSINNISNPVEIIELKDIGGVDSSKLGEISVPQPIKSLETKEEVKPVELKKPDVSATEKPVDEKKIDAPAQEPNKQTVSDKFKLPAHSKELNQPTALPFPTDNLVDIPPIHGKKSDHHNANKKKGKKPSASPNEISKNAGDELNSKDMEENFNLDYSASPNKLIEYNNSASQNSHLPKLVSKKDYQNATFLAIDNGDIETFIEYAKKMGNYEFTDNEGNTLLIYASMYEQENIVKWLLNHKANVNAVNMYGASSLHAAVINNDIKIAKLLVSHNIDKSIKDQNSKIALDYVISGDMKHAIEGHSTAKKGSNIMKYKKSDNKKKLKAKKASPAPILH